LLKDYENYTLTEISILAIPIQRQRHARGLHADDMQVPVGTPRTLKICFTAER
jgi:hypothetical protein